MKGTMNELNEETDESRVGVKRKNDAVNDDERSDKHQKHNDDDVNIDETRIGLKLMGLNVDMVDWLLDSNLDVVNELNENRRAVRLYGKGQQFVQAHVSEARIRRHV